MSATHYAFEITIQARAAEATVGQALTDAWGTWPTLEVPKAALATPLAIGFDAALERLGAIERLYAEPDGSFVWACSRTAEAADAGFWQVDGNAAERDGRLLLVDLKGSCPAAEFDRLLAAFGWPEQTVMMQLVRAAAFLDEATFRRHATARGLVGDGQTLRPT
jgi:hypothetical protein